jgi:hypothetical protein
MGFMANQVEVGELGERVAEGIVYGAFRFLPSVQVRDRNALQRRCDGRGDGLRSVADKQECLRSVRADCPYNRVQRVRRVDTRVGWFAQEVELPSYLEPLSSNEIYRATEAGSKVHSTRPDEDLEGRVLA